MKLDYLQALKRVLMKLEVLRVLHGQEPLLERKLNRMLFGPAGKSRTIERQRFGITVYRRWKTVFNALNSLSLFSSRVWPLKIMATLNLMQWAKELKSYLQHNEHNLL